MATRSHRGYLQQDVRDRVPELQVFVPNLDVGQGAPLFARAEGEGKGRGGWIVELYDMLDLIFIVMHLFVMHPTVSWWELEGFTWCGVRPGAVQSFSSSSKRSYLCHGFSGNDSRSDQVVWQWHMPYL